MISIIIATYNSGKTIQRCLDSIYNQNFASYEILVKDGASTDNTVEILNSNVEKIYYLNTSNDNGVYDAWNHCLKRINGDWFLFLGSDDYFEDCNFLFKMNEYFVKADESTRIIYGKNKIINDEGDFISVVGDEWDIAKQKINSVMTIRHPGCFHHKSLLELAGLFDDKFKIVGDHHYILRSLKFGDPIFYPFVGVVHSLGGISTNPNLVNRVIKETYKLRRDLNLKPFVKIDTHFVKRVVISGIIFLFGKKYGSQVVNYIVLKKK
ncbi:glycosyltransferase [Flavobacterium sp. HJJ]|uniref:glycosyltransferase n=1 Tax=Flavobacterium sp. HJJ TaxID=2783792 RepID=UPI00188BA804|nr:glycosyltransferase [Flavobacterium sp. HJJ]MBF4470272.1 glycosyltransferase [Flavobacterium sp. HJJ]